MLELPVSRSLWSIAGPTEAEKDHVFIVAGASDVLAVLYRETQESTACSYDSIYCRSPSPPHALLLVSTRSQVRVRLTLVGRLSLFPQSFDSWPGDNTADVHEETLRLVS